mmetsp:Transcript_78976/g.160550  ORF Transcript_78976/g.160550 Transcript_78976/m.160550 type:complete len:205 (+) Transcript_78976:862-1476(+)
MLEGSLHEITDILCGAILAVQKDPSRFVPVTMELTTVILTGDPHVVRGKLGDHHFRKPLVVHLRCLFARSAQQHVPILQLSTEMDQFDLLWVNVQPPWFPLFLVLWITRSVLNDLFQCEGNMVQLKIVRDVDVAPRILQICCKESCEVVLLRAIASNVRWMVFAGDLLKHLLEDNFRRPQQNDTGIDASSLLPSSFCPAPIQEE